MVRWFRERAESDLGGERVSDPSSSSSRSRSCSSAEAIAVEAVAACFAIDAAQTHRVLTFPGNVSALTPAGSKFIKGALNAALVEAITPHVLVLRSHPYGKKVVLSSNNLKK
ncbi:uncharacterized protein A4U43_C03F27180 [Asparagus officinalis]|uniref:Uncharacterized protein n=1 Tax=Asparagus officinalis TaxID=4686 RepID=A0A5P1FIH9_ASPOF|nr:uncharacterized protein A4U43_C03F27180 [Asparagus officinalis]